MESARRSDEASKISGHGAKTFRFVLGFVCKFLYENGVMTLKDLLRVMIYSDVVE